MKLKFLPVAALMLLSSIFTTICYPQTTSIIDNTKETDTDLFDFDFNILKREVRPSIRLYGGHSALYYKSSGNNVNLNSFSSFAADFVSTVDEPFFLETNHISKNFWNNEDIYSIADLQNINRYLSQFSHYGVTLNFNTFTSNIKSLLTFGFTDLEGAGYKFSENNSIRFLSGNNVIWAYFPIPIADNIDYNADNSNIQESPINIEHLTSGLRFGTRYQSEINFKAINALAIYVNANRTLIFPCFIFWKYLGSEIVYTTVGAVVDLFTDRIRYSYPYFYPIVDFVLTTALKYGLSELQRSKMNFPFNSVAPVVLDNFSIGLQYKF